MDASDYCFGEFSRFRRSELHTFHAREGGVRGSVENQVADGIFDATIDAAPHLSIAGANPGVPRGTILNLAARKSGVSVQLQGLVNFIEAQVADGNSLGGPN